MIKVSANADNRSQVLQLAHVFRARVVDVSTESVIVEITGAEDKIDGLLEVLRPYGILEMVRTGRVAMARGAKAAGAAVGGGASTGALYADEFSQPDDVSYSV